MMVAPKLMAKVETRYLILAGLIFTAGTLYQMTGFTLDTPPKTIVIINIIQGVGLGLLFVPVTSAAFATLPNRLRTSGTAINTLVRNIGSSIGISMVIANLTSKTTYMHERLTENVAAAVRLLVLTVDVDDVVIGGGLSSLGDVLLADVRAVLGRWAGDSEFLASLELPQRITLVPHGVNAAAIGAALVGAAEGRAADGVPRGDTAEVSA